MATRTDLLHEIADLRGEMRIGFAQMDTKLERQLRIQLVWLVGTVFTLGGLIVALH